MESKSEAKITIQEYSDGAVVYNFEREVRSYQLEGKYLE